MSFISELFHGNVDFGNLAPQNLFKDTVSSFQNQPEWAQIAEIAIPAALTGGALLAPELAAAGGAAAAEGGLAAAEGAGAGFDLATIGPGLGAAGDIGAVGEALPAAAAPAAGDFGSLFMSATPGDMAFAGGGGPIPFSDIAGGLTGGGGADLPGGVGGFDWASAAAEPPAFSATGGAVGGGATFADPSAGAFAGAGPFGGASDISPDLLGPGGFQGGAMNLTPAGAPGAAAGPGAATAGSAPTSLFGAIGSDLKAAAPWLGAAGMGYNLFQGYQSQQALKTLQQQEADYQNRIAGAGQAALKAAGPMLGTGEALMTGGKVPAPMQALLDNFRNAQRAQIIQGYAARGQSADPKLNTSLAQDLNAIDNQMLALREQLGQQIVTTANTLLQSGASATQIAAELPMMMQRLDMQLQQMSSNAIANFASAMSGGTMKVSGQGTGQNINLNLGQ